MVFVWLTAFFLVVALIVLVIYQVSPARPRRSASLRASTSVRSFYPADFPAKLRRMCREWVADLHVVSVGFSVD
jgi:hypothetical protein